MLVTAVLDTFGKLVYERIYERAAKADGGMASLSMFLGEGTDFLFRQHSSFTISHHLVCTDTFESTEVIPEAKETCNNWFFKIASIRELLPRMLSYLMCLCSFSMRAHSPSSPPCSYVEIAVLRCYKFIAPKDVYTAHLSRLERCIRGIGNPLVAAYTHAYLVKKGAELNPDATDFIVHCFDDIIHVTQRQVFDFVCSFLFSCPPFSHITIFTVAISTSREFD